MPTFLVSWNPIKSKWKEQTTLLKKLKANKPAVTRWPVTNKNILEGDRIFFMRLGREPKGIIASGSSLGKPFEAHHWDTLKKLQGKKIRYINIQLDMLLDLNYLSPLPRKALDSPPFNKMHWSPQNSGIHIPADIAHHLEKYWELHLREIRLNPVNNL